MIKSKDSMPYRKPVLDLTGPDGNAYAILGYASNFSKQLNLNYEEIHKEMTSSDYENLIEVFDKYFGEYIDLVR